MHPKPTTLLQGTLDLLILKSLLAGEMHDARKRRRRRRSSSDGLEIVERRSGTERSEIASGVAGNIRVRLAHDVKTLVVSVPGEQRDIRQIALAVAR